MLTAPRLEGSPRRMDETCYMAGKAYPNANTEFVGKWVVFSPGPDNVHNYGEGSGPLLGFPVVMVI